MGAKKTSSKRANHEGTVYKNKRGLWIAQATIGYDENGKQIRKAVSGKTPASKKNPFPESVLHPINHLPVHRIIKGDKPGKALALFQILAEKQGTLSLSSPVDVHGLPKLMCMVSPIRASV